MTATAGQARLDESRRLISTPNGVISDGDGRLGHQGLVCRGSGAAHPELRAGSLFPSLLERSRRIDQALFAVVMEAYLHGVSTRKVDDLVKALGADTGISKSEASRICADLDAEVAAFRDRSLAEQAFPYVFLDAIYCQGAGQPAGGLPGRRHRHRGGRRRTPRGARLRRG